MTENMKRFLELACKEGKDFVERLKTADKDGITAMAAEKGVALTDADFVQPENEGEISLDEADAAAGGKVCFCAVGGGGEPSGDHDLVCACVGGGYGSGFSGPSWDYERKYWKEEERCICAVAGSGITLNP